jgi:hypothetical protein
MLIQVVDVACKDGKPGRIDKPCPLSRGSIAGLVSTFSKESGYLSHRVGEVNRYELGLASALRRNVAVQLVIELRQSRNEIGYRLPEPPVVGASRCSAGRDGDFRVVIFASESSVPSEAMCRLGANHPPHRNSQPPFRKRSDFVSSAADRNVSEVDDGQEDEERKRHRNERPENDPVGSRSCAPDTPSEEQDRERYQGGPGSPRSAEKNADENTERDDGEPKCAAESRIPRWGSGRQGLTVTPRRPSASAPAPLQLQLAAEPVH